LTQIAGIVQLLKKEHDRLTRQIQGISAALSAFGAAYGNRTAGRRKLSAAGRARIAEAQRLRWSKLKGDRGQTKNSAGGPKKRSMSAAGRRRIVAAQKLRWAKVRATQKRSA
jgi:hypothetical protein